MVSPGEFISVAEEMGIIVEIGEQVLRKACLECRRWPGGIQRRRQPLADPVQPLATCRR